MRGFQFATFFALALLGLACSTSTASAYYPICKEITNAAVKAGSSFHGAACKKGTGYTRCSCTATFCEETCLSIGKTSVTCHGLFSNSSCTPNTTAKTP